MTLDLTIVPGPSNESGSSIVLRDSSVDERSHAPGTSTVGREDGFSGGRPLSRLVGPMLMVMIIACGRGHQQEVPSNITTVEARDSAADPSAEGESGLLGPADREDERTEPQPEKLDAAQPSVRKGKCRRPDAR